METLSHKRYKLGEKLFSNSLGELFLGRDLQATTNQRLLFHSLPKQLLKELPPQLSLNQLKNLGSKADILLLKVVDYAWSEDQAIFVMETPEAWSFNVLPALQGQPTNLHQKALQIAQQLMDQSLVSKGIDSSLFLVTASGDLYLLGTALLTELQALAQQSPNLLQPQPSTPLAKKTRLLPLFLLGGAGLVAAGSLGIYQFAAPSKPLPMANTPIVPVSVLDKPSEANEVNTALAPVLEPKKPIAAVQVEASTSEPVAIPTQSLAEALPEPAVIPIKQEPTLPKPEAATVLASLTASPVPTSNITLPPTAQTTNPATANPQATQHLEHATEAINHGHLQTGLYYLRLAKKLDADQALLQNAAKQLIEKAQLTANASETLSPQMQTSIKQEFGLN